MSDHAGEGAPGSGLRPILVLALDGATFDVIEPMVAAGELPNLARWMKAGQASRLPSTTPPVTFPAWSSFMTGLPPAEHGIFDFTQKRPGEYRLRFVNATDRPAPSIFRRVCDAGGRVLVLGMPATHPPEPVSGLLVCGFDAPVSAGTDARSASDPALYEEIASAVGPWMRPALDESARADDFHERAVSTLLDRIDRKRDFALEALARMTAISPGDGPRARGGVPDLTMIVFSESDTAGHHYWRDHDRGSPRHDASASPARRGALADVYRRLDAACGAIHSSLSEALTEANDEAGGEDLTCIVLSDHGMGGASDKVVHLNRYLAECGLLHRSAGAGRYVDRAARRLRDLALAILPAGVAQQLFRRARSAAAELESRARFGGFDWRRTRAFSEEANTNPGIWINLAGREAAGCVAPQDYERVRDEVLEALRAWHLPSGKPVVARALRREEIHSGQFCERVPDIVLELALDAGYGLSLVPTPWAEGGAQGEGIDSIRTLDRETLGGGRGRGMNGTHRSDGIWIASRAEGADEAGGSKGAPPQAPPTRLDRVAPWLARAMGLAWDTPDQEVRGDRSAREAIDYDADEEAMVAERLRALGYLE
jgi:predicted AlkP superfamily phosphohydrolase/phosphomutase